MPEKKRPNADLASLDPHRKTPFSDAELDVLAEDFIDSMSDTEARQDLVAEVGELQAREVLKQR